MGNVVAFLLQTLLMISLNCRAIDTTTTTITSSTVSVSLNNSVTFSSVVSTHNQTWHPPNHNTSTTNNNSVVNPNSNNTTNNRGNNSNVNASSGITPTTMVLTILPSQTPTVTGPPLDPEIPIQDYAFTYKFLVDGKFTPTVQNANIHNMNIQNTSDFDHHNNSIASLNTADTFTNRAALRDKVSNFSFLTL